MSATQIAFVEASVGEGLQRDEAAVPRPVVADLWGLFDDVCQQRNAFLEAAGASQRIVVTHRWPGIRCVAWRM